MTIYEVIGWDAYASSMGDTFVAGRYLTKSQADTQAATMNAETERHWATLHVPVPAG